MGRTMARVKDIIAFSFHDSGYGTGKIVITLTTMSMSSTKYLFNICFDIKSRAPLSAC